MSQREQSEQNTSSGIHTEHTNLEHTRLLRNLAEDLYKLEEAEKKESSPNTQQQSSQTDAGNFVWLPPIRRPETTAPNQPEQTVEPGSAGSMSSAVAETMSRGSTSQHTDLPSSIGLNQTKPDESVGNAAKDPAKSAPQTGNGGFVFQPPSVSPEKSSQPLEATVKISTFLNPTSIPNPAYPPLARANLTEPTKTPPVSVSPKQSQFTNYPPAPTKGIQPELEATQPMPAFNPLLNQAAQAAMSQRSEPNTLERKLSNPPQAPAPSKSQRKDIKSSELEEKIQINKTINELRTQQKKSGSPSGLAIAIAIAFMSLLLASSAAYFVWVTREKLIAVEQMLNTENTETAKELQSLSVKLTEVEKAAAKYSDEANKAMEIYAQEAEQRKKIQESISNLATRLDALEGSLKASLGKIDPLSSELANLKNELENLAQLVNVAENRAASGISSVQRRVEAIENFLIRATRRSE